MALPVWASHITLFFRYMKQICAHVLFSGKSSQSLHQHLREMHMPSVPTTKYMDIYKLSGLSHLCSLCFASLLYILFQHFNDTGRASDSRTPLCFRSVKGSWLHAGLSSTPACSDSNHRKDECWNGIIKFILHLLATPQHFSISLSYSLLATRLYVYIEAPSKAFGILF